MLSKKSERSRPLGRPIENARSDGMVYALLAVEVKIVTSVQKIN